MKFKLLKYIIIISSLILLLVLLTSYAYVSVNSKKQTYNSYTKIPYNHIALLPGTSKLMNNGKVNLFFTHRCDAVAELWENGKVFRIIISGDSTSKTYDEPELMRQELLRKGLPDSVLLLHKSGYNTKASIYFCKEKKIERLTIVSQKFHNERAILISKKMGINAIGYNANPVYTTYGVRVMIREWFARVKLITYLIF